MLHPCPFEFNLNAALQCAPLQARLRLLNDWADVQRKLPEKAMESSAGGRTSHLLRPCPTPSAPDVWPVPSSKAGGVYGLDLGGGRGVRSRGVRAGGGADVTCPSLLFVFQVMGVFFLFFPLFSLLMDFLRFHHYFHTFDLCIFCHFFCLAQDLIRHSTN